MTNVRRGTKEFRKVSRLLKSYRNRRERRRLINLYAFRPGSARKTLINEAPRSRDLVYDLNYAAILSCLENERHKLYRDRGMYYFKSSAKSEWKEFPFEFTGKLRKEV
ncbi:MAG: hypothetical protein AB1458_15645 [Bacteroidota bacterium]